MAITATRPIQTSTTTDETEIRELIGNLHQAHHNKDAAAIVSAYAPDAALFTLAPPLAYYGVNLKEKQTWLDSWNGPIDLELSDLKITISEDTAFAHGFVQMKGAPKMAGREISFWMRLTVCLRREAGTWRIVHEHTSVPFYMDGTQRAAFDLKP